MERIGVILNPNSRDNRRRPKREEALRRIVGDRGRVYATQCEAELRGVIEELLDWNADCLVSTGGDGALNWLINEARPLAQARGRELPPAVPTNSGTIDFVARKVGISGRAENILARLTESLESGRAPSEVALDSLEVAGRGKDESEFRRIGFAVAAGGIGNRFFDELYRLPRYGGPEIVGVIAAAVASHAAARIPIPWPDRVTSFGRRIFRPTSAIVTLDGEELPERTFGALHAGSFDIVLGPLKVFPLANAPGRLHFQAGDMNPAEIIRALPALFRGGMIGARLHEVQATEMKIEALGDEMLDPVIDGEIFRGLVDLTIRPGPPVKILQI